LSGRETLTNLRDSLTEILDETDGLIRTLDAWVPTVEEYHGREVPWEALDDLWRVSNDLLTSYAQRL